MKIALFLFLLTTACIYSCKESDAPIAKYLTSLEHMVEPSKLLDFKNASKDSAYFFFKKFDDDVYRLWEDTLHNVELNNYFKSNNVLQNPGERICFLCFAFYFKLNNEPYNIYKIKEASNQENAKIDKELAEKERLIELDLHTIKQKNDKNYNVGDTLSVNLPVLFKDGYQSAYYCQNNTERNNYSKYDDSLSITGELIQKNYYPYKNFFQIDTLGIEFKLKIIKLNHPNYLFYNRKYEKGDTIEIDLRSYDKIIK
jgi:hypothetical protein